MIILLLLLFPYFGKEQIEKDTKNEFVGNRVEITNENNSWELRKHEDGVFIYQRWIEAELGRKARDLYAEILVAANPDALTQIIRDEKYGTKWLSMADEYKVLKKTSDQVWVAYSRFDLMPALRFDLITRNELHQNLNDHSITVRISGEPDYIPEDKKYRRLSHFEGQWEFVPIDSMHTRIRYYLFSKTKPFLPRWITDPFVFGELENCVSNVKHLAEQL